MGPALLLFFAALPAELPERSWLLDQKLSLRLVSGSEWDTNARRAVNSTAQVPPVSDGLVRVLVDADASVKLTPLDRVSLSYVLGAKRFFRESTEDLVAHDLVFESAHRLLEALSLETRARFRASRIRSGARDYTIGSAGGGLTFLPWSRFSFGLHGRVEGFDFGATDELSYLGPAIEGSATFHASQRFQLGVFGGPVWRAYQGYAYRVFPVDDGSYFAVKCDGSDGRCPRSLRTDTEVDLGLRASFRGTFIVGGEALLRLQRSTSELEVIDRYRLSAYATVPLPLDLTLSLIGALQYNHGLSASQQIYVAEDDENQNSLEVQVGRRIFAALRVDLRYALYANEFATAAARFLRQTVYLGVSYALDTSAEE